MRIECTKKEWEIFYELMESGIDSVIIFNKSSPKFYGKFFEINTPKHCVSVEGELIDDEVENA